jgi:hypothetical protein
MEEIVVQHPNPSDAWTDWLAANDLADEADKLTALHEIIVRTARDQVRNETYSRITAEWANKKLAKLGIPDRIGVRNSYVIEAPISGTIRLPVGAANRTAALALFESRVTNAASWEVSALVVQGAPVFASGPADEDPNVVDPDVPTTVQGTLDMLREIIMLGHIAGPKYCEDEANDVLASFGLAPIPPRRKFTVTRPVTAEMSTTVDAYDEESAQRVAAWRWADGRGGYNLANVDPTDELTVTAAA